MLIQVLGPWFHENPVFSKAFTANCGATSPTFPVTAKTSLTSPRAGPVGFHNTIDHPLLRWALGIQGDLVVLSEVPLLSQLEKEGRKEGEWLIKPNQQSSSSP